MDEIKILNEKTGEYETFSITSTDKRIVDNNYILNANDYLPDFLKQSKLMLSIVDCLNVLISTKEETFRQIHEAYFDMEYKTRNYSKLSYEAKIDIMKELGFEYLLDISTLSSDQLTQLLIFFNLIYLLKGKEEGMRLFLDTLGIIYTYETWDNKTPKGQPLTATLNIVGNNYAEPSVFSKIKNFVRSYMLPWIEVIVEITIEGPNFYVYPSFGGLTRLKYSNVFECKADVLNIAIYDDQVGYDRSVYGAVINTGPDQFKTPLFDNAVLKINTYPSNCNCLIDNEPTNIKEVELGSYVDYRVYLEDYNTINYNITGTSINIEPGTILTFTNGLDNTENPIYTYKELVETLTLEVTDLEGILICVNNSLVCLSPSIIYIQDTKPETELESAIWYNKNNIYLTKDHGKTWNNENGIISTPILKFSTKNNEIIVDKVYNHIGYIEKAGHVVLSSDKLLNIRLDRKFVEF